MAWYHEFEGGRVFYTALGHTTESYSEPEFLHHVLGGIHWVIGGP
jgi:type 1 glutamine amidotransferase